MDDIQVWIYILFGIIYFLVRAFKKKEPQSPPSRPRTSQSQPEPERKPVTFEELLREFTEGREEERAPRKEPVKEVSTQKIEQRKEEKRNSEFEEGRTRAFADEESRRVYEESIARAEGAMRSSIENEFSSKIRRNEDQEEERGVASEIKDMLNNPADARKAMILSEILNRKY